MQPVLTALQGAVYELTSLKQEFEQIRIFELDKYIIKMA